MKYFKGKYEYKLEFFEFFFYIFNFNYLFFIIFNIYFEKFYVCDNGYMVNVLYLREGLIYFKWLMNVINCERIKG